MCVYGFACLCDSMQTWGYTIWRENSNITPKTSNHAIFFISLSLSLFLYFLSLYIHSSICAFHLVVHFLNLKITFSIGIAINNKYMCSMVSTSIACDCIGLILGLFIHTNIHLSGVLNQLKCMNKWILLQLQSGYCAIILYLKAILKMQKTNTFLLFASIGLKYTNTYTMLWVRNCILIMILFIFATFFTLFTQFAVILQWNSFVPLYTVR